MRSVFFFVLITLSLPVLYSQDNVKSVHINRTENPPKIDGMLTDEDWKNASVADGFFQFWPDNGADPWQQSEVKFLYDNSALYVGAMLYDTHPDSILFGLSERDNINNADYMGIYIDPQGSGMNGYGFFVTSSGVQLDMKVNQYFEDDNWDAVWSSATSLTDSGWIAEFKIPYTAIRFPKTDIQNWKINVWRNIMRHKQNTTWNYVDRDKDGTLPQSGELKGVKGIKPPVRLSLSPYISAYVEKNPDCKDLGTRFNGGMDIKYGLNESFTLDMTLIPDFSQVQSDRKVLNLSPYETYYSEKRPFFNEGTELFNKLRLFHSRRIGGMPSNYGRVFGELNKGDSIINNPTETRMINASKISGKTKNGLGIGLFNAMTAEAYAVVEDSTGAKRNIVTQPFTNYNMVVLDQDLKNNSSLNFSNTNLYRPDDQYSANVSGSELSMKNKTKRYNVLLRGILSQKYSMDDGQDFGHSYYLRAGKISGKFQGNISYNVLSDDYDINAMGFMFRNNMTETSMMLSYNRNKPFWILNNLNAFIDFSREGLYKPSVFTTSRAFLNVRMTFKNLYSASLMASINPQGEKDYFEPRVTGRFVNMYDRQYSVGTRIGSDTRKKLSVSYDPGIRWWDHNGGYEFSNEWSLDFRFSDRLSCSYETELENVNKEIGWVETNHDDNNIIYFGKRDINTVANNFSVMYIFNKSSYLDFNLRHYNRNVKYDPQFYELEENGDLRESDYSNNKDQSYNAFNIDLKYAWRFAPGSELSVVWKNVIENNDMKIEPLYLENLEKTLANPQTNSISIKVIYYLDYLYLVKGGK